MQRCGIVLLCMLLAACSGQNVQGQDSGGFNSDPRPLGKTLVYECTNQEFIARLGPGEMAIWLPDRYLILSQERSASGVRYREGDVLFSLHRDEVLLEAAGQRYTDCREVPGRAPWEDARRRGVSFRAVGNEPGWYLEIQRGRHMLYVGDYGANRVLLPTPEESREADMRVYHAVDGAHQLRVEIIDEPCTDTMKGDSFPSQVLLQVDGRSYVGCGRDLDYPWE